MGSVMDACLAGSQVGGWTPASAAVALFVLFGAQSGMVATRGRILAISAERVAARLRNETFASLVLRHDVAFFDRERSGELQSRLSSDCTSLQKIVVADLVSALRASFLCAGSTVAMLSLSPPLFAVSVTTVPVAMLVARRTGERMKARQREVQDALAEAGAEAERALGNIRTLKLFAAEPDAIERYAGRVDAARQQAEAVGAQAAITEAGVGLALQSSLLAVLAIGGQQVIDGTLSYGDLSAFLMYSMFCGFSAANLASAYAEFRRAAGASERILHLLEPASTDRERSGSVRLEHALAERRNEALRETLHAGSGNHARTHDGSGSQLIAPATMGRLDFESVSFAYAAAPSKWVLNDLNLTVGAGERVALLGRSGSGKSTVANLIAGLYMPQAGRVCVDGVDVDDLDRTHLRTQLLSVVPQEPTLFAGSLRENLLVGRPGASEDELRAAADAAGCADFADEHWHRNVGERGGQLSGGQKQRIALARVLLRDTPIVVLDEFSSALDPTTEGRLFESLRTVLRNRTLLVITHRESALALVDRVVHLPSSVRSVVEES